MAKTEVSRSRSEKRGARDSTGPRSNFVYSVRLGLVMSRAEFAEAFKCGLRSVYHWENDDVEPTGLYLWLFEWVAQKLNDPAISGERWGRELLGLVRTDDREKWLSSLRTPKRTSARARRLYQALVARLDKAGVIVNAGGPEATLEARRWIRDQLRKKKPRPAPRLR